MDGQILQTKSMFFYLIIPSPHLNEGSSSTRLYFSAVISSCDIADCIRWCIIAVFLHFNWILWIPILDLSIAGSINQGFLAEKRFCYWEGRGIHLNSASSCSIQHTLFSLPTRHGQEDNEGPTDQHFATWVNCWNRNQLAITHSRSAGQGHAQRWTFHGQHSRSSKAPLEHKWLQQLWVRGDRPLIPVDSI